MVVCVYVSIHIMTGITVVSLSQPQRLILDARVEAFGNIANKEICANSNDKIIA